ncbi:MAG TPA: extracellular solute-binding protein [Streptosporangiaceae bacterium]|nr:extracellular solute-binding protein [Streptosporangiaceae bacterium]
MSRSQIAGCAAAISALALAVVGCGGGTLSSGSSSQASKAGAHCQLHVLGETRSSSAETAAWNQVFADFKAKYHCTVTATWEGEFTAVPQMLNEARLSGQPVDFVTDATSNYNLVSAGDLLDLNKLIASYRSRFPAAALQPFTIDGKVWAVPTEPETSSMFFYNATLFHKLGLTAPQTFAQLVHDAQVIKAKTNVQPVVEGGNDTWEWPMWYMATYAQTSGNNSVADTVNFLEGKQQFTSPQSVQALADIAEFSKDGLLQQSSMGSNENGAVAAFVQGKAAMMFDGSWDLPTFRAAHPKFSIGAFLFPLMTNTPGVVAQSNGSPTEGLAIPSFIPKGDLPMASQFLEFITSPSEADKIFGTLDPIVPTITGVAGTSDPLSSQLQGYLSQTNGWLDWIWPTDVVNYVETAIEGVLFGGKTPLQAAQSVQGELNTLRQTQNYNYAFWTKWSPSQLKAVEPATVPKINVTQ